MIITLELRFRTKSSAGIFRRAIQLIGHIPTIPIPVTMEVRSDTMAGSALERVVLTLESGTTHFVGVITAIVLVIATPPHRNTFAVAAMEFGFGTFAIASFTYGFGFVGTVAAIVREVAHPLFWNATVVRAFEICVRVAPRAILR